MVLITVALGEALKQISHEIQVLQEYKDWRLSVTVHGGISQSFRLLSVTCLFFHEFCRFFFSIYCGLAEPQAILSMFSLFLGDLMRSLQ